jgi:hypothetical protein
MKNMKLLPEQTVLVVVLVLFGAAMVGLALSLPAQEEVLPSFAKKVPEEIPFEQMEKLSERMIDTPEVVSVSEDKPVFVSRMIVYYPANSSIEPLDKNKELPGVGIPAAWLLKNNLSIEDVEIGKADADNDGFTNLEEYQGQTNPQDAQSRPPVIVKLRMKEYKAEKLPIEFKGRVQGAGGYEFQVAFKGNSKVLKPGAEFEGYKLGEYREIVVEKYLESIKTTVKEDVSELDITYLKLNEMFTLVLRKTQDSDQGLVDFVLQIPGGKVEPSRVKRGDSFKVFDTTYQLIKASETEAVIRDKSETDPNKTITVPRLS